LRGFSATAELLVLSLSSCLKVASPENILKQQNLQCETQQANYPQLVCNAFWDSQTDRQTHNAQRDGVWNSTWPWVLPGSDNYVSSVLEANSKTLNYGGLEG